MTSVPAEIKIGKDQQAKVSKFTYTGDDYLYEPRNLTAVQNGEASVMLNSTLKAVHEYQPGYGWSLTLMEKVLSNITRRDGILSDLYVKSKGSLV